MTAPTMFLDFDGVLHPADVLWREGQWPELSEHLRATHTLFEHSEALAGLLRPFPQVRLVLSTAWVRLYGYQAAASRLPKTLQDRLVGATFDPDRDSTQFTSVARGYQILSEVKRRRLKTWVAVDDDSLDWPRGHAHRLIATDPVLGLSAPKTVEILERWLHANGN